MGQLTALALAFLAGITLALTYDLVGVWRCRFTSRRITALLDGAYCLLSAFLLLSIVLHVGSGRPRIYLLLGIVAGAATHFALLSRLLRPLWSFWLECILLALSFLDAPRQLFLRLWKKIAKSFKILFYFFKKCSTIGNYQKWKSPGKEGTALAKKRKAAKKAPIKKKKAVRSSLITKIILAAALVIVGTQLYSLHGKISAARAEEAALAAESEATKQEVEALKRAIENADDPDFIEEIARNDGLVRPGEKVFYDVSN